MFSKNKDDKHKACLVNTSSQHSMQNKKKERRRNQKTEILRQILLTLHMGQMNLERFT